VPATGAPTWIEAGARRRRLGGRLVPQCPKGSSEYSDDEPGSPWSYFLCVDERGDEAQRSGRELFADLLEVTMARSSSS
jgi:hypothetical protein